MYALIFHFLPDIGDRNSLLFGQSVNEVAQLMQKLFRASKLLLRVHSNFGQHLVQLELEDIGLVLAHNTQVLEVLIGDCRNG